MQRMLPTHAFMFFAAVLLFVLMGLSFFTFWRETSTYKDELIVEHVSFLADIFKKIDEQCSIINFEHARNYVDFLTVESFVGSEVGSMNLKYPDRWQGPYLDDNPTIQEKYYEIVHTHKGYFIVPGEGVVLGNGKTIGKDILFSKDTDITKLIDEGVLEKNGKALVSKILISGY